jgi:hypothetical protein
MGQKTSGGNYSATIRIRKKSKADAGIAAIGDEKNLLGAFYRKGRVELTEVRDGKSKHLNFMISNIHKKNVTLRMTVRQGKTYSFYYSFDGKNFTLLNPDPVDGSYLPPWDRAVRAGIAGKGGDGKKAIFDEFEIIYEK